MEVKIIRALSVLRVLDKIIALHWCKHTVCCYRIRGKTANGKRWEHLFSSTSWWCRKQFFLLNVLLKSHFLGMRQIPICPAEGALLRILAWHGAAGGGKKKKNHSSWTVKTRRHTGVGTHLAEPREPAGVGVSTAALQIKQRAAHDSPGWMPRNTARHASRSIHCLKLEAPSGTTVWTVFISHQIIVLLFW